jgi:hypothetical protein
MLDAELDLLVISKNTTRRLRQAHVSHGRLLRILSSTTTRHCQNCGVRVEERGKLLLVAMVQ